MRDRLTHVIEGSDRHAGMAPRLPRIVVVFVVSTCSLPGCGTDLPYKTCAPSDSAGSRFVLRGATLDTNAIKDDFHGDWSALSSGGNVNVFLRQTVGAVERKVVIIVPSLSGEYDLSHAYLSYTETEGENKKVWKAVSGSLRFLQCDPGVVVDVSATMEVLPAENNTASGSFALLGAAKSS